MRSAFFEFSVARSALFTARNGINVVSHNIANRETPGFSRQYAEQRVSNPIALKTGKGMVGTGSEIYGVNQVRDFFVDKKYWSETGVLGEYSTKNNHLKQLELSLAELTSTGLSSGFNAFFDGLKNLQTTAGDDAYRTGVIKLAQSLQVFTKNTAEGMKQHQSDINEEVKATVSRINSIGNQIRSISEQIKRYELSGDRANDLRDSRAVLVDELSSIVNVEVREVEHNKDYAAGLYPAYEDRYKSDKEFQVYINGYDFIIGDKVHLLETVKRDHPVNPMDAEGLVDIRFQNRNHKFDIYSASLKGSLKGLIDVRDGNSGNSIEKTGTDYTANVTLTPASPGPFTNIKIKNPDRTDLYFDTVDGSGNRLGGGLVVFKDQHGNEQKIEYSSYTVTINAGVEEINFTPVPGQSFPAGPPVYAPVLTSVGKTDDYKGIPYYMDQFNTLLRTFAKAMNDGTDMQGNAIPGVVGHIKGFDANDKNEDLILFSFNDTINTSAALKTFADGTLLNGTNNYDVFNSFNFILNKTIEKDPKLLATSDAAGSGISNNKVILGFSKVKEYDKLFGSGNIEDFVNSISSTLAVDRNQAQRFDKNYTTVTQRIQEQRMSISSVDYDEEIMQMMAYNQMYRAATQLINVIDGMYDTMINKMGLM